METSLMKTLQPMFFGSNLPVSVLLVQVKRHIINLIVVAFPHKSIIKCRAQSLSLSMSWHLAVFLSPLWWTGSLPLYKIAFWYLAIRDGLGVHMHPKSWHCQNWVDPPHPLILILAPWRIWPKKSTIPKQGPNPSKPPQTTPKIAFSTQISPFVFPNITKTLGLVGG